MSDDRAAQARELERIRGFVAVQQQPSVALRRFDALAQNCRAAALAFVITGDDGERGGAA